MAGAWGPTDYFDSKSFFGDAGGAVNDIFAAMGKKAEAKNYGMAADLAGENAQFTKESTAVKLAQTQRDIYKVIGGQQTEIAGSGFEASGSGLDLLRDSSAQGALEKNLQSVQGAMTEAGFEEQQQSYLAMQKSAKGGVFGSELAAAFKIGGMILAA